MQKGFFKEHRHRHKKYPSLKIDLTTIIKKLANSGSLCLSFLLEIHTCLLHNRHLRPHNTSFLVS